jgi:hypothetical protein
VRYIYYTEEEAIQALAYINEFTKQVKALNSTKYIRGRFVEVRDEIKNEDMNWQKKVYLDTIE